MYHPKRMIGFSYGEMHPSIGGIDHLINQVMHCCVTTIYYTFLLCYEGLDHITHQEMFLSFVKRFIIVNLFFLTKSCVFNTMHYHYPFKINKKGSDYRIIKR